MDRVQFICVDFETLEILADGSTVASTEAYRENFRVSSCAFSWYNEQGDIESKFVIGEPAVRTELQKLSLSKAQLVAHNVQFEIMVSICRFPDVDLNWYADTMRLVQNWDNGGDKFAFEYINQGEESDEKPAKKESTAGLGLVKSLKRIFGDSYESHKQEAYEWLNQNVPGCKKGKEGKYLDQLPAPLMEAYNIADTENTLKLFTFLTDEFAKLDYDWTFDHRLYLSSVRQIVEAKIRGVKVDRIKLQQNIETLKQEIKQIEADFLTRFSKDIQLVERARLLGYIRQPKTDKGRKRRLSNALHDRDIWNREIQFNSGSNKQLEELFVKVIGIQPKFFTAKGSPSFKSSMLDQWGEGGKMLKKRRKRLIVLAQCEALLELSEYDGRWHISLRAAGTQTGRFIGSN